MSWRNAMRDWNTRAALALCWLMLPAAAAAGYQAQVPGSEHPAQAGAMTGIVFRVLPAGGELEANVVDTLRGIAAQLGATPTSLADVDKWSDQLTSALRQRGFPIAQVLLTEEDWPASAHGSVRFTAYPGRIREIVIQNKSRVDTDRLRRLVAHALCGTTSPEAVCLLSTARLERATQLLQDVPGVAIERAAQFSPGAGVGDVNVVFSVTQKGRPAQADVIFDNKGIQSTGAYRMGVTASGNNYLGLGESYAVTAMVTDKKMWTGSLTGSVPILDDGLRLTGGLTRQQYTINAGTPVAGVATTVQEGLQYPITRGLDRNIWVGASMLQSQASTSYHDFGIATHTRLNSVRLSVQADNGDRAQQLRTDIWSAQAAVTAGHQSNDDPSDAVVHRSGHYGKATAAAFGSVALSHSGDLFLTGRVNAQFVSRNMDASEKLPAGGPNAVRAYRADEGSYDDGAVLNLGLYQRFPLTRGHQLQVGIFTDYARGRVNHAPWPHWEASYIRVPGVTNIRTLAGYGASLDWLTPIGATLSLSVAKPYGFASSSWVDPGNKPLQYWLSVTWSH